MRKHARTESKDVVGTWEMEREGTRQEGSKYINSLFPSVKKKKKKTELNNLRRKPSRSEEIESWIWGFEDEEGRHSEADQRRGFRIRYPQRRRHGFSDHSKYAHFSW